MSNRDMTRSVGSRGVTPLSDAVNQLFRDAFTLPVGFGGAGVTSGVNLYETTDGYVVQALLPGVNPDQLTITARENVLTLQGKTELTAPKGARAVLISAASGDFREQLQLPGDVDADEATADYQNGVLTLTLPKAAQAKVRTIKVGRGQPQVLEGENA
jgi:HSP20 family protein